MGYEGVRSRLLRINDGAEIIGDEDNPRNLLHGCVIMTGSALLFPRIAHDQI